jgi:SAM-dependent methyltransferase
MIKSIFASMLDGILRVGGTFEERAEGYFPFTPLNILYMMLEKKSLSILDVGCGKGHPMRFINRSRRFSTVGIDLFAPYIRDCKMNRTHDDYVLCDMRALPFKKRSFDLVLGLRVCEHLTANEAERLLADMECIARRQVVIIVPAGTFEQSPFENNPYQRHRSYLTQAQLKQRGYKVQVNGLRGVQGDTAKIGRFRTLVALSGHMLWVISGPIIFLMPSLGANLVAAKNVRNGCSSR